MSQIWLYTDDGLLYDELDLFFYLGGVFELKRPISFDSFDTDIQSGDIVMIDGRLASVSVLLAALVSVSQRSYKVVLLMASCSDEVWNTAVSSSADAVLTCPPVLSRLDQQLDLLLSGGSVFERVGFDGNYAWEVSS